ncbi:hypothetical protein EJ05DRAFT_475471 [Pseudovirgaria hyperparasitica]|uniref:Uncharacterized protein n=1 Tax=Pseudovirgaria hyperparasitica TaxID=470096 RepID=A0A6A6WAP6_9PEZI|nr:uncharacterized protein EJ05DRAFT_475471 [Pseudovirgaria hyperparasitica]KAF2759249.1 hypothetical protein EJ05DRAFT_475471 [Pseudovirgaria hyperparasitica]
MRYLQPPSPIRGRPVLQLIGCIGATRACDHPPPVYLRDATVEREQYWVLSTEYGVLALVFEHPSSADADAEVILLSRCERPLAE